MHVRKRDPFRTHQREQNKQDGLRFPPSCVWAVGAARQAGDITCVQMLAMRSQWSGPTIQGPGPPGPGNLPPKQGRCQLGVTCFASDTQESEGRRGPVQMCQIDLPAGGQYSRHLFYGNAHLVFPTANSCLPNISREGSSCPLSMSSELLSICLVSARHTSPHHQQKAHFTEQETETEGC